MSDHQSSPDGIEEAECRLDLTGLREQRDRYRALGRQVATIDRRSDSLRVRFGPGLDADLLERTLSVEHECCPFFRLGYEPSARLLTVSVDREEQEPALEAIAHALTT